ncbi:heat shock protein Hsp70-6 [Catenaria anguillulae PL171]|uniref:Heat shock protein Hsp70-6 n=1 Tax=Catenaria anguillulae PL171 TaxID=765915 RepID=A0A1Y2HN66_9FUNG|nr:heat shock protein Hsp70-6 [Catenaria anguillulae PL171]
MPPKKNNQSANKKKASSSANKNKPKQPQSQGGAQAQAGAENRPATPANDRSATATPVPEEARDEITVAFSIGSEYSTFTLLPKEAGARGEIIANEDGERQIPSVVAIAGTEEIAGTAAKAQAIRNIQGTAKHFFPLIGLSHDDPKVQSAAESSLIPIEANAETSLPEYVLTHAVHASDNDDAEQRETRYTPEQLTSILLGSLKQSAESYTSASVTRCVLSYPTDFTVGQQQALARAAEAQGMHVVSLIPEPVAAVLAFEHIKRTTANVGCNGLVMAVDIGASSTTLTLMNVFAGLFTQIAHTSIAQGGNHLDALLAGHFAADFTKRNDGLEPKSNKKAWEKLLVACETTRKVLSQTTTSNCHVESFMEGIDYVSVINRTRFETLAAKWKRAIDSAISDFLDAQNLDADEIDHVLCIGGVSASPMVHRLLEAKFGRAEMETGVDADEAVAYGTAIHGLQPKEHHSSTAQEHSDREAITPHLKFPIGVLDVNGHFSTVIPKDSPLPIKHAVVVPAGAQAGVLIQVAEGRELEPLPEEDEDADEDEDEDAPGVPLYKGTLLGEVAVVATEGQALDKVELVFTAQANGKLHVSATGIEAKTAHKVHVTLDL